MRPLTYIIALVMLAVLFVAVNLMAGLFLRHARIDLTERALYTLSAGTARILAQIDEPIKLQFYFSRKLATDYPLQRAHGQRVADLLDEMAARANGRLTIELIDPAPFSDSEDDALGRGLVAQPIAENEVLYFGLVGSNLIGSVETIAFFAPERRDYLEYDLARLIYNLAHPEKPHLGILSNLPLDTGAGGIGAALRGQSQAFLMYNELIDRFAVDFIAPDVKQIPATVDVLLLAHPRPLSVAQNYAIDQFVMRGGRVIAFIDPQSEVSLTAGENGEPLRGATEQSNMVDLMRAWGVVMDGTQIIADRARAQKVAVGQDLRRPLSDYILWLALIGDDVDDKDVVTAGIERLHLGTVGRLVPLADATTQFQPLVWASNDAGLLPRDFVLSAPSPDALLQSFMPLDERLVIAARLSGRINSSFAHAPEAAKDAAKDSGAHIASTDSAHILLFADSDFFDDRFWVSEQVYQGQRFGVPIADNAKFLLNAVEHMMGSQDLISLRGRERGLRLFTRVEALRRVAQTQYRAEEERLLIRIDAAQSDLNRLEREAGAAQQTQSAAQNYRRELLAARKALRKVQGNLNRDIVRLGAQIMWLNITAMPIALIIFGLGMSAVRRARRRATQKAAGLL